MLAVASALPTAKAAAVAKGRFHPAICAYSFRNQLKAKTFTYADVIRMAAETGADGVDLTTYWLEDTSDATLFPLKRQAYRAGIELYTLGVRVHLAQPTPELQTEQVELVKKWADAAQRLGAGHIRVFGGTVPKGATEDQAVVWAVETMKRCTEEAGKRGITLGLEDDGGLTTNADRTIEIVRKTDSQWAGINLDIGNFPTEAYAQIAACAPYATNVHFKTNVHIDHHPQPADWPRVLQILGAAGYRGYLSLEYEEEGDALHTVPALISRMKSVIAASA